jgi:branched-chain amino acid transport system ATP-binding protein
VSAGATLSAGAGKEPLLAAHNLTKAFGELRAVSDVSLSFFPGELVCVIGPNGAGKTTLVNLLSGRLAPDAGRIVFAGGDITRLAPHDRVRLGLGRSFQITSIFPGLSVAENLAIPVLARMGRAAAPARRAWKVPGVAESVRKYLDEWQLADYGPLPAASLSHGSQRLLEIAVAMAGEPRLLILDEPTSGLSLAEKPEVLVHLRRLAARAHATMVLVEHDMDIVFSLASRIVVMHQGMVLADGAPEVIRDDGRVREVYLGAALEAAPSQRRERAPGPAQALLTVRGLEAGYGLGRVVQGVSLTVHRAEVVALLGRNGAGKTTTLKSIMGLVRPSAGEVELAGRRLTGLAPHRVAAAGIGYAPEERRIFAELTVRDNLAVADQLARRNHQRSRPRLWPIDQVYALFPDLARLAHLRGDQLSGGQQKMLAIGRALMGNPEVLLLDEASEGLAPPVVRMLGEAVARIRAQGVSILMAEQNAAFAGTAADRLYILEKGRVQFEASSAELGASAEILHRYLAVAGGEARASGATP